MKHIYYIDPAIGTRHTSFDLLDMHLGNVKITRLNTIAEVFPILSNSQVQVDFLAIDVEYMCALEEPNYFEIINTIKTLINCTVHRPEDGGKPIKRNTKLLGLVDDKTNVKLIKDLTKLVDGIAVKLGGKISFDDIIDNFQNIINNDLSLPKVVNDRLKQNNKLIKLTVKKTTSEISLTPRQQQIYSLVSTRGASNKVIAKTLSISESTVKLHVSAILKKYGVRNRTQLAVFAAQHES